MQRTLISRGLAVVFVFAVAATAALNPASAVGQHPVHRRVVAHGKWVDPGQTIDNVTPTADGSMYVVTMHGGTHATGRFAGDSSYTMTLLYDPVSQDSIGFAKETYRATLDGFGQGHVTLAERVQVGGDGWIFITARIVAGDGVFSGAHGHARFTGQGGPSAGPASGQFTIWFT